MNATATTNLGPAYKVIGTTDEWDHCDCCGRQDLKVYVRLQVTDSNDPDCGEILHVGTTCASILAKVPAKAVKAAIRTHDDRVRAYLYAIGNVIRTHRSEIERAWFVDRFGADYRDTTRFVQRRDAMKAVGFDAGWMSDVEAAAVLEGLV